MRYALLALKEAAEIGPLVTMTAAIAEPGATVEVVHVLRAGDDRVAAEHDVAAAADTLCALGLSAHARVEVADGGVPAGLAADALAHGAQMVVMGSRGLGRVRGLMERSVSRALLASTDLPVLVLPDGATPPTHRAHRVLAAVASEADARAIVAAIRLLPGRVDVVAVHVPRAVAVHAGDRPGETFVEIGETSTAVLAEARRRCREAGIRVAIRTLDRDGGVAPAIVQAARDLHADLVVLGPRRPGDWEALVGGSALPEILHLSHLPVLIAGGPTRQR